MTGFEIQNRKTELWLWPIGRHRNDGFEHTPGFINTSRPVQYGCEPLRDVEIRRIDAGSLLKRSDGACRIVRARPFGTDGLQDKQEVRTRHGMACVCTDCSVRACQSSVQAPGPIIQI